MTLNKDVTEVLKTLCGMLGLYQVRNAFPARTIDFGLLIEGYGCGQLAFACLEIKDIKYVIVIRFSGFY